MEEKLHAALLGDPGRRIPPVVLTYQRETSQQVSSVARASCT